MSSILASVSVRLLPLLAAFGIGTPLALAQVRAERFASSSELFTPVWTCRPPNGDLIFVYPPQPQHTIATPLHYPSDASEIRDEQEVLRSLLISGRSSSGVGRLIAFEISSSEPVGWNLYSQVDFPGADIVGVAYSKPSSSLVVLDGQSGLVSKAAWTPGTPLPAAGAWVGLGDLPSRGYPLHIDLRSVSVLESGSPTKISIDFVDPRFGPHPGATFPALIDDGTTFSWVDLPRAGVVAAPRLGLPRLLQTSTAVRVVGTPQAAAEVVRVDGANGLEVVAAGSLGGNGSAELPLVQGASLVLGGIYAARPSGGAPEAPYLAAQKIWGAPLHFEDGRTLDPWPSLGNRCFLGSPYFAGVLRVREASTAPAYPWSQSATLVIGDAQSSVVEIAGASVLLGSNSITVDLVAHAAGQPAYAEVPLPIPSDPLLAGAELRLQWVVLDSQGLALSEVLGVAIRAEAWVPDENAQVLLGAAGSALRSSQGRSGGRAPRREGAGSRAQAWSTWMAELDAASLTNHWLRDVADRLARRRRR